MAKSTDIYTKRLLITPFTEKHITAKYVDWLNDRELMRYSEQRHKVHTFESCRKYWRSFEGTPNFFWAIEEIEHGLGHIGNMNAYIDEHNSLADIGIVIGEEQARGKSFATEAWIGVCHFLFQTIGTRKVTAGTLSVNLPMLKVMHRIGMVEDGIRKRHYVYEGQEVDMIHMAFFKEQWKDRKSSEGIS